MTKILILESNSPDMVENSRARGENTGSDLYASALKSNQADVEISIVEPYAARLSRDDLDWADGIVFTGSGVNWSTDAPEAAPLREAGSLVLDSGNRSSAVAMGYSWLLSCWEGLLESLQTVWKSGWPVG